MGREAQVGVDQDQDRDPSGGEHACDGVHKPAGLVRRVAELPGVEGWDAQAVAMSFERARGKRAVGERIGGGFGGPDRRTLFMLTAEWAGTENVEAQIARRTGRIYVADVEIPGAGWP